MSSAFRNSSRGLVRAAGGGLLGLLALAVPQSPPRADAPDHEPPAVLVLPCEAAGEHDMLRLAAHVEDASGVGGVTLWAKGEGESQYSSFVMEDAGDGRYVAELPPWPERGSKVAYFVEASDAAGNGPRRSGGEKNPYIARLGTPAASGGAEKRAPKQKQESHRLLLAIGAGALLIGAIAFLKWRGWRESRRQERLFWHKLLSPLADLRGSALQEAVTDLSSRKHAHPSLGAVSLTRAQIFGRLERLRVEALRRSEAPRQDAKPVEQAPVLTPEQRLTEDLFWYDTLAPLLESSPLEQGREIDRLSSFPHPHPLLGMKIFERQALLDRLEWARKTDVQELRARRRVLQLQGVAKRSVPSRMVETSTRPVGKPRHMSAGMSLLEVLLVLSVLSLSLGIAGLYLKPMQAPLHTGAVKVDALMRQARALAMASTSAHRVRPETDHSLVVETATSCSSATWTDQPGFDLEFPPDVTMSSTAWGVCFSSRGLTSQNTIITLNHPTRGSQQLEVMLGGSLRWLP